MDIFVGSLSFKLKESELREAFEKYGKVSSAKIIIDKITRQSKGFGFVEMPDDSEARLAISSLNGAEMYGRALVVNESQKRETKPGPSGGGGSGGFQRPDFRKEGFNRPPRPAENDRYAPRDKPATSAPDDDDLDDDSDSGKPSAPSPFGGPSFTAPDRHRNVDRKPGGNDKGHADKNHGGGNKAKLDSRYGRGEFSKKGGGGSKRHFEVDDDDDTRWF